MDRLISEQVDDILTLLNIKNDIGEISYNTYSELYDAISMISAEPNTGHWITDVDKWGDIVTTVNGYRCDKCNAFNSDKDNYCPNCGARMVKEQESEDKV